MPGLEGHPGLDRTLAVCLGTVFAALLLVPSTRLCDPKAVAASALAAILFLGAALALASDAPHAWRFPPFTLNALWAVGAAAFLVALLASPYRRVVGFADPSLPCAACVSLGLACAPRVWGRSLLKAWVGVLLVLSLYALAQRAGLEPFRAYAQAGSRQRSMGSYGNADYLAAFLCLSWPLLLAWRGRLRIAALALAFAALLSTQSRAALLALLVQVAVLIWFRVSKKTWGSLKAPGERGFRAGSGPPGAAQREGHVRPGAGTPLPGGRAWTQSAWVWLLPLAVLVILIPFLFPASQWFRPTLRWPLWQASLALWFQRPWSGWGPGAFALAFQDHAPQALRAVVNAGNQYAEAPHQLLLGLACSAGVLGLAAFAVAAFCLVRLAASSSLPEAPVLVLGVLGLFLESQADRFFFSPGVFAPLAIALGLVAWRGREADAEAIPAPARGTGGLPHHLPSALRPPTSFSRSSLSWLCMALTFACAWSAALTLLRSRQGVGDALDSGVGILASAGDPAGLAAQVQAKPDDALTLERLGDSLAARRQYQDAARALGKALALQPTPGRAQNLGDCYMMLGRLGPAEAAFRLAVRLAPGNADAHFSLGYALYYEKRLKEALVELDTALRLDPEHAGAAQLKRQILR